MIIQLYVVCDHCHSEVVMAAGPDDSLAVGSTISPGLISQMPSAPSFCPNCRENLVGLALHGRKA